MASDNPFDADPSKLNVENEARKTVDSSWDSPFHTLGKGSTQAAPGNHTHDLGVSDHKDLTGRTAADQHNTASITGLDAALAGKSPTSHTHSYAKVTVSSSAPASPAVGDIWCTP